MTTPTSDFGFDQFESMLMTATQPTAALWAVDEDRNVPTRAPDGTPVEFRFVSWRLYAPDGEVDVFGDPVRTGPQLCLGMPLNEHPEAHWVLEGWCRALEPAKDVKLFQVKGATCHEVVCRLFSTYVVSVPAASLYLMRASAVPVYKLKLSLSDDGSWFELLADDPGGFYRLSSRCVEGSVKELPALLKAVKDAQQGSRRPVDHLKRWALEVVRGNRVYFYSPTDSRAYDHDRPVLLSALEGLAADIERWIETNEKAAAFGRSVAQLLKEQRVK